MKMQNLCRACGNDFASVSAFEQHWKGKRVDARRQVCRDPEALRSLVRDARGRWTLRR